MHLLILKVNECNPIVKCYPIGLMLDIYPFTVHQMRGIHFDEAKKGQPFVKSLLILNLLCSLDNDSSNMASSRSLEYGGDGIMPWRSIRNQDPVPLLSFKM